MKFCEGQNVNFTVSPQALSKALAEEGIIQVKNGQNTYTKRYGGNVRRRVMCIKKSEVIAYEDLGTEAIRLLTVENLPAIVVFDDKGVDLYETAVKDYCKV